MPRSGSRPDLSQEEEEGEGEEEEKRTRRLSPFLLSFFLVVVKSNMLFYFFVAVERNSSLSVCMRCSTATSWPRPLAKLAPAHTA